MPQPGPAPLLASARAPHAPSAAQAPRLDGPRLDARVLRTLVTSVGPARGPPAPAQASPLTAPLGARPGAPRLAAPDGPPAPRFPAPAARAGTGSLLRALIDAFLPAGQTSSAHLLIALEVGVLALGALGLGLGRGVLLALIDLPARGHPGYRAVALRPG